MNSVTAHATGLLHSALVDSPTVAISVAGRACDLSGTITAIATTTGNAQAPIARRQSPPSARAKGAVVPAARAAPALSIAV